MRFQNPSLAAAVCLLFSQAAPADIIVLRNGEKLEGSIVREDEDKKAVLDDAKTKRLPEPYLAKLRERAGLPLE
jgi:hypothetical protein